MKYKRKLGLTMLGEKFTQREEVFAARLTEKIPGVQQAERLYVGFLNDLRFNRFVNTIEAYKKAGRDITKSPKELEALASVIAAATGRGELGPLEGGANALATVMFSPRWVASRIQLVTNTFTKRGIAQTEAIKGLATVAGFSTAVLGMAAMAGADVETDMRSSDFGKIKTGNTRFDVTGGLAPYIRLMAQVAQTSTKSTTTGKIYELNTGEWGSRDTWDIMTGFLENKASPFFGLIKDFMKGETFGGEPLKIDFTKPFSEQNKDAIAHIFKQLFIPLIGETVVETYQNASGGSEFWLTGAALGAEFFGIGVNSYGYNPGGKDWERLKDQFGDDVHAKAVKKLNEALAPRLKEVQQSKAYQNLSIDEQNKLVDALLKQEKEKILDNYKIKKEKTTKSTTGKKLLKQVEKTL